MPHRLAAGPTTSLRHIQAKLNQAERSTMQAQLLDHEASRLIRCSMTADQREAAPAFVEKRAPQCSDR